MDSDVYQRLPRLLVIAFALPVAWFGTSACGESGNCLAQCSTVVIFELSEALTGDQFTIRLRGGASETCMIEPGGQCRRPTRLSPVFAELGALKEVQWNYAQPGDLSLTIEVDGELRVQQSFSYRPRSPHEICGNKCYEGARFVVDN